MNQQHENHARCFPLLERVQNARDEGFVSGHTLAEMYSVLTTWPRPYRHTPEQALLSISENVQKSLKIITLNGADYVELVREAAALGVQGGTIYDAITLRCAEKAEVERIFTLNVRHFQNLTSPELRALVTSP